MSIRTGPDLDGHRAPLETPARMTEDDGYRPETRSRRGLWLLAAVVAAAAVAGGWYLLASGDGDGPAATAAPALEFAPVVRTDLVTFQTYEGTLGYTDGDRILSPAAGTLTGLAAEGSTVASGDTLFAVDGEPVVLLAGDVPAWRDLGLTVEDDPVLNRAAGTITGVPADDDTITQGDVLYTVDGEPVVLLYGATPAWRTMRDDDVGADVLQLETALVALGYDPDGTVTVDDEYTYYTELMVERWQEALGVEETGVVSFGDVIFLPDDRLVTTVLVSAGDSAPVGGPVFTVAGEVEGVSGDDVAQLESALVGLGFDADGAMTVDGEFTVETETAVIAWQRSTGADDDGVVHLGEVVFLPGPVRIGEQLLDVGSSVGPGAAVLATSSTTTLITLDLPTEDRDAMEVGDRLPVTLPDDTPATGTVTSISDVATTGPDGESTFEVIITIEDAAVAAGFDETPVDVDTVSDEALDVLAVPVTALLALAEGGYAVEVDGGGGQTRLVAVDPGLYADGLVEIDASGIGEGDLVVVP